MDANIRHRRGQLQESVTDALFAKLNKCLEYSGESLYESLKRCDIYNEDTILKEDLVRVLKRIGLSNVEPHLHLLLETGGASMEDERIDIQKFAYQLTEECRKLNKDKNLIKERFLRKLHSMLCTKGLSLFDFFMRLDVNKSSSINKVELKTGMQQLGIPITSAEFEAFWKAIYKA